MSDHVWNDLNPLQMGLLRAKLGKLLDWSVPQVVKAVGPFDMTPFQDFDAKRVQAIKDCRDRLLSYSPHEINWIVDGQGGHADILITFWNSFMRDWIVKLTASVPPWYAGGLGHPDYAADFEHWTRMTSLRVAEIVCLSVGIDPLHFPPSILQDLRKDDQTKLRRPLAFLIRRLEQVERRFTALDHNMTHSTREVLDWIEAFDIEVPAEFLRLLRKFHRAQVKDSGDNGLRPAKGVTRREFESMAKLVTTIAIRKFNHNPNAPRTETSTKIAGFAAEYGIDISAETVRSYLQQGRDLLKKGD